MIASLLTREGLEEISADNVSDFVPPDLKFTNKRKNKKVYQYAEDFACLDTETSHDGERCGWVYQWAFTIGGRYVIGRRPSEIVDLLRKMRDYYGLHDLRKIIIYVHNLSYDFQYIKHYLKLYDKNLEVFAIDNHGVLTADVFGFRFICSYHLSNMSLDLFSKTYAEKYLKAKGLIDYEVVRYQDSDLTREDWEYMLSDVASQHDAIGGLFRSHNIKRPIDAPITNTGFVRNDCRKASQRDQKYRRQFQRMALQLSQYNLLREAFAGGLTIANFKYAGATVSGDIGHVDFRSSYPARIMIDYFPIGKPMWYGHVESMEELEAIVSTYCAVFMLHLEDVRIKAGVTAPCIPSSKCIGIEDILKVNGKVVYAKRLSIAVTEIDFKWIRKQYTAGAVSVSNVLIMKRGRLPEWFRDRTMYYYANKSKLKKSDPRLYQISKGMLNGIYGMTATRIIRDNIIMTDDLQLVEQRGDDLKQITKYYASWNSFLPYQWGVYTTAHARDALLTMIEAVGYENFLYCDTDSVFYKRTPQTEEKLQRMNFNNEIRAREAGAVFNNEALGEATKEPDILRFRALHAKCYAMEEKTDAGTKLVVTIAGIPKRTTKWKDGKPVTISNAEELGDIDNLEDGFIFRHNGGTRTLYIEDFPREEIINGYKIECASAAIILPIEKEISGTMWSRYDGELYKIKQEVLYN